MRWHEGSRDRSHDAAVCREGSLGFQPGSAAKYVSHGHVEGVPFVYQTQAYHCRSVFLRNVRSLDLPASVETFFKDRVLSHEHAAMTVAVHKCCHYVTAAVGYLRLYRSSHRKI
jgi:hypothetical protein